MSLILSGTDGLSDVDGSAATPAIRGTDANTGIFFPAADTIAFAEGGAECARFDSAGNFGLGVTPSAWGAGTSVIDLATSGNAGAVSASGTLSIANNGFFNGTNWIYKNSSSALLYQLISNQHRWSIAASGTAGNTISFTQAMTLDASGKLGIGTTTPQSPLQVKSTTRPQLSVSYDGITGLYLEDSSNSFGKSWKLATSSAANSQLEFYQSTATSGVPVWSASAAMTLDASGNLLVGTTSTATPSQGFVFERSTDSLMRIGHANGTGSGSNYVIFGYNSGVIGTITQSGTTAVAYNTSSDYRLKNSIASMTGALAKVALLKPVTYKWNVDNSDGQGFIAHELAEVVPDCVTGAKDAVDKDGKPQYQGVDTSFLVATLTAAIQEQQALITTLTARITALESA